MRTFLIPGFNPLVSYKSSSSGVTPCDTIKKTGQAFGFSAEVQAFGSSGTSQITMSAGTFVGGDGCPAPPCRGVLPGYTHTVGATTYVSFTHTKSTQLVRIAGKLGTTYNTLVGVYTVIQNTKTCNYYTTCPPDTTICPTRTTSTKVSNFATAYTSTYSDFGRELAVMTNWGFSEKPTKHFPVGMPTAKIPFRSGARMLLESVPETLITTTASSTQLEITGKKCKVFTGSFDIPLTTKSTWKHPVFVFVANTAGLSAGEPMPWMAQDGSRVETPCFTYIDTAFWAGQGIRRVPVGWFGTNLENPKWTTSNALPNGWSTKPFTTQVSGTCSTTKAGYNQTLTVAQGFADNPVIWAQLPGETFVSSLVHGKLLPNCKTMETFTTFKSCKPRKRLLGEIEAIRSSLEKPWIDNKGTTFNCTPNYFKVTTARADAFGNAFIYKHFRGKLMAVGKSTMLSYWKNNPKGGGLSPYCKIGTREVYGTVRYAGAKPKEITMAAIMQIHNIGAGQAASMLPDNDGWRAGFAYSDYGVQGTAILGPLATGQNVAVRFQRGESSSGNAYGWLIATDKAGATGSTAKLNDGFAFEQMEKPFAIKPTKTTLQYTSPYSAIMDQHAWDIPNKTALGVGGMWWSRQAAAVYDAPLIARTPVGWEVGVDNAHTHFSEMMSTISPDATSAHPVKGSVGTTPWRTLHAYNPQFQD